MVSVDGPSSIVESAKEEGRGGESFSPLEKIESIESHLRGIHGGDAHGTDRADPADTDVDLSPPPPSPPLRLLHIVTSLSEFESGTRGTTRGKSRFRERLVPVLNETCWGLVRGGVDGNVLDVRVFDVSVQLVLGYDLSPPNLAYLRSVLPPNIVDIRVWNSAIPTAFDENAGEIR